MVDRVSADAFVPTVVPVKQVKPMDIIESVGNGNLNCRVLMVGAGGIGCELLKNLVMSRFLNIEIVDLDTIDLSNLNRQFLFQKQHVKKSKAHVARAAALRFNPDANIISHHDSIFNAKFDVAWFASFDIVLNALDNLAARRHVNLMCLAANVPLVESGTAGYFGQVSVHRRNVTHCYDCEPKPTPKTFPVCTIRSTPSLPIHCIVWAKNYLFNLLFGTDEEDETIDSTVSEENARDVENLKQQAEELRKLKEAQGSQDYGRLVFDKIYSKDIERLRSMADMWKNRSPPKVIAMCELDLKATAAFDTAIDRSHSTWTLDTNALVFLESIAKLSSRVIEGRKSDPNFILSFDKDDDAAMDFVVSASNLRSISYDIETLSLFKAKEMAGNIIPAIATTNAIVAGLIVLEARKVLQGNLRNCKNSFLSYGGKRSRLICSEKLPTGGSSECTQCSSGFVTVQMDPSTFTVGEFVGQVLKGAEGLGLSGDITISENGRLLFDEDFDDNVDVPLGSLGVTHGKRLIIVDDRDADGILAINFFILESTSNMDDIKFKFFGDKALSPHKTAPRVDSTNAGKKRKLSENGENDRLERPAQRVRADVEPEIVEDDIIIL